MPIARGNDGSVLDVGRSSRTVGWRLRKALEARDGGCRFPGCGSRLRTHAHDFGLARWHGQPGIVPSTGCSLWRGERIEWGWAMVCLWGKGGDGGGARAGAA